MYDGCWGTCMYSASSCWLEAGMMAQVLVAGRVAAEVPEADMMAAEVLGQWLLLYWRLIWWLLRYWDNGCCCTGGWYGGCWGPGTGGGAGWDNGCWGPCAWYDGWYSGSCDRPYGWYQLLRYRHWFQFLLPPLLLPPCHYHLHLSSATVFVAGARVV